MNILITGSTGFLGKALVKEHSRFNVFTLNRTNGNYHCDLSNTIPVFTDSFDIVIHNAGKAHSIPTSNEQKEEFFQVNVNGTTNLLKALEVNIPKRFIFISSVSVYGRSQGELITEECGLDANDPYGLSKIEAEKIIKNWCNQKNVICSILRLPLVVGPNPPGNLGAMINSIRKGYYFNIDGGKAKKSMVLAEDVAKFILKASEVGGEFNLSDGYHPSFKELSSCISIQIKKPQPLNLNIWFAKLIGFLGDIRGDGAIVNTKKINKIITNLTFDDSKARAKFGWDPKPVLKEFKITIENKS